MQWLIKCCARGVLGLGAAALLLTGVPAHAGSAAGAPADLSRESQPLLLVQSTAPQEEARQLEKRRLQEQQERERLRLEQNQKMEMQQPKKMRSLERRAPSPSMTPEAVPAKPGTARFGAGVIRNKESVDGD